MLLAPKIMNLKVTNWNRTLMWSLLVALICGQWLNIRPEIATAQIIVEDVDVPATILELDLDNITSFDNYLDVFNKRYLAKYRIERRKHAFEKNLAEIMRHNQEFKEGNSLFQMGVNNLADLDNELYKKRMVRMRDSNHRMIDVEMNDEMVGAAGGSASSSPQGMPESLDWRQQGFKTGSVNQKTCGSCYAFSISYAISGQIMQRIGRMEFVSQQQLVDCSVETGNQGCAGGSLRYALKYLEQSGGIMREVDYPYTSSVGLLLLTFILGGRRMGEIRENHFSRFCQSSSSNSNRRRNDICGNRGN
ncbi:procathepsin L-like [Uranotaenia lowii]|uniref:procathepsin L-like n=1 Tax=Uranotaenia lowii TaxID=190385 RepID=UPI00247AA249|nr:procathepsin L-like [Uranotaenia lowii]